MAWLIGALLAVAVGAFATGSGFDRERVFYPTVMLVVAHYYILFATMGGSGHALLAEAFGSVLFIAAAVIGFRSTLWIVVAALAGHGVFDLFHGALIGDAGVPAWWPAFCSSYTSSPRPTWPL